jgi:hypothetical protein
VAQLYLRALGSVFVYSYDSQGYSGGILTHLHTGLSIIFLYTSFYVAITLSIPNISSDCHPVRKRAMLLRMSVFTHFHTDPSEYKSEPLERLVASHASISHLNFFGLKKEVEYLD